ncbi:hypothetical protein PITC_014090 [Penicillium italicum]|uniref:Uncharacterized protein n=1 Tax=Penicillium italicum TaxID=40296 RepID=A0A0A2KP00_PENIT|nr:hypothetical protein PITC_014090 [Penicillium italicum]
MARNLDSWKRKMIVHMISSKNRLTTSQMAKLAKCSERSITQEDAVIRQPQSSHSLSWPATNHHSCDAGRPL